MKVTVYPGRFVSGTALIAAGLYNTIKLKKAAIGFTCLLVASGCLKKSIKINV